MSPALTLSVKSCAANLLKVVVGAGACAEPSRTLRSSSWSTRNACIASETSTFAFTSLSLPVRGSFVRPRIKNPPSFLRQTPGLLGRGTIHEFHLRIHFVSVIVASCRRRTGASELESTAAEERVEGIAAPHPGAGAAAAAGGLKATFAVGLADRTRGLEAAVARGGGGREEGRPDGGLVAVTGVGRSRRLRDHGAPPAFHGRPREALVIVGDSGTQSAGASGTRGTGRRVGLGARTAVSR